MTDNDCISRKALLDALPLFMPEQVGHPLNGAIAYARAQIEIAPSLDVAPAVHGRWVGVELDTAFMCSKCGHTVGWELSNYCPNCGAKMGGDADG